MYTQNSMTSLVTTTEYLSTLDKTQLNHLLQHRILLLVSARNSAIVDADYINELKNDVEKIQSELRIRNT